jgi:hypothetical protein
MLDPGNSLIGIEPGKHREHRGQPRFAALQRGLDPVENALLASGQAHDRALPAYRRACVAPANPGPHNRRREGYRVPVTSVDTERALLLSERIADARSALEDNIQRLRDSRARMRTIRQQIRVGRTRRELVHHFAYARLEARLETMPVIEQAKGIVMAQTGCTAEQAFDMLRQASQRSNIKVRDLASAIVYRATGAGQHGRSQEPALRTVASGR